MDTRRRGGWKSTSTRGRRRRGGAPTPCAANKRGRDTNDPVNPPTVPTVHERDTSSTVLGKNVTQNVPVKAERINSQF